MVKSDNNFLLIGILIVGAIFVFTQSSKIGLQATLGPEQYQTMGCADVTTAIAQDYTLESTDSHGCQIYTKQIPGTPLPGYCWTNCYPANQNCGTCGPSNPNWATTDIWGGGACVTSCPQPTWTVDRIGGWTAIISSCQYDAGDLLAVQTFPGSTTVTRLSTRYPIKRFCNAHPAIITDSVAMVSQTSTLVYDMLWNGTPVTTTPIQTLTLFYIMQNNYQLPTYCGSGTALSINTCIQGANNSYSCSCVPSLGVVYSCTSGIYDPAMGLCVVQPQTACPLNGGNGRLQQYASNGSYYCVYTFPVQADCSPYGLNSYYDVNQNKCIFTPDVTYSPCTLGNFNSVTKTCVYTPANSTTPCPSGYNTTIVGSVTTCVTTPPSTHTCPSGSNYDPASDSCNIPVTKIAYSCVGVLTPDNTSCIMTPSVTLNATETTYGPCPAGTNTTNTPGICTLPPLIVQQNSSVNSSSNQVVGPPFDIAKYLPWGIAAVMAIGIGYLLMRRK